MYWAAMSARAAGVSCTLYGTSTSSGLPAHKQRVVGRAEPLLVVDRDCVLPHLLGVLGGLFPTAMLLMIAQHILF